ncbi:hypothetical protein [Actinomyces mediterranea]|uniref:hypothetical protein n=1 Tax=Actinomyces mediterranea TaxID=1871028 RepID=UPI000971231A|nr:hypothetical protein [Actinomyces mediterranea]
MLGTYDFCGHYAWTFTWLRTNLGEDELMRYWREAVSKDAQRHARRAFMEGFSGMEKYWGRSLAEEGAGYTSDRFIVEGEEVMRIDMYACPSQGFLLRNGLDYSADYCSHCAAWIEPALEDAGYSADHEHDHLGHCWWEIRAESSKAKASAPGAVSGHDDVRLLGSWSEENVHRVERRLG